MISDYLFKGIDNIFNSKLSQTIKPNNSKQLTRDLIKANINTVIKQKKENNHYQGHSPMNKSRLRAILQQNKQERLRSVFRQSEIDNRSPSPYHKIQANSASPYRQDENDKILYYREQRKVMEKSRVLQKSRVGQTSTTMIHSYSQAQIKPSKANNKEKCNQKGRSYKLDLTNVIRY